LNYIGSKREKEKWTPVLTGSLWDGMKLLGSYTTIEQTNTKPEQEFGMALERGSFAGPRKRQGKSIRERGQVSELQVCCGG
jgi:hypothetical protein